MTTATDQKPMEMHPGMKDHMTAEQIERYWYDHYYQGDTVPQLTVRSVVMGMALGGFMSLSNLYVGLKTGWGLGVAITACILSYAIWNMMRSVVPQIATTQMSILENNCMQSTASSAGYSTGGTMTSAIAAYLLVTGVHMSWPVLAAWTFCLAALGVFMAIPMKRQMINIEQLRFPSGVAAAETLKSLHAEGGDAVDKARSLTFAGIVGAIIAWFRDAGKPFSIPGMFEIPGSIMGLPLLRWTIGFEMSAIMIAAGAIMGWKIAWSLLLGGVLNYAVVAPWIVEKGAIEAVNLHPDVLLAPFFGFGLSFPLSFDVIRDTAGQVAAAFWVPFSDLASILELEKCGLRTWVNNICIPLLRENGGLGALKLGYKTIVSWSTWTGASIMVSAGLLAFAFQWKTVIRAFGGLFDVFSAKSTNKDDPLAAIEVPSSWFLGGIALSGLGCLLVLHFAFETSIFMGIVAVLATFFLSVVACRATGESDITPVGAMGKITQLVFGVLAPSNITTNLMTASVTAGAAGSAADLLTDLKSGYLLGANPRKQFIAQFMGIFAGTLVVVPAFYLLVPSADVLGGDKWPAPSAQVWAAVAKLLANGLGALHETARWGILIGVGIGIALTLLEMFLPKSLRPFVPSAMGIGLAMVIPFFNSLSMFLGAVLSIAIMHWYPKQGEKYIVPVSSGVIAGESLLGIVIALLGAGGYL